MATVNGIEPVDILTDILLRLVDSPPGESPTLTSWEPRELAVQIASLLDQRKLNFCLDDGSHFAVDNIRLAWTVEGRNPAYHAHMKEMLSRQWPSLYGAILDLL